jgi:hypothetical protein
MGISDATENNLLKLMYNATTWANYAIDATSSPQTNIHVGLHTADPGDSGTMSTSEATYTDYGRVNVARSSGGWTVTANSVSPVATISFTIGSGGSGTVTYFSTGKTGGGATDILLSGTVTPNIITGNGVLPELTTATAITLN